ncbi:siderophore-interacting FAD-binding domain [Streptomyces acidiscabies]|nr:siderophore-interacting FAD-binding domain [Streptomyces acidiscabies]GAV38502.1 siderophore-interacting FAD-binding domain [Streptomyces acidiscabies]
MVYETLQVSRVVQLTPHMVRITLTAQNPATMIDAGPDQYTKIFLPLPGRRSPSVPPPLGNGDGVMSWYQQYLAMPDALRPPMRNYTVRAQRPSLGEADYMTDTQLALAQLPKTYRRGRRTLIRADSGGGTHEFLNWLTARGRWPAYSVGMTITDTIHHAVLRIPASAWTPAVAPEARSASALASPNSPGAA